MSDCRNQLFNAICRSLVGVLDPETQEIVSRKVLRVLNDYEITKRVTAVVPYDDTNERILKRYCATLSVEGASKSTIYAYRRCMQRFFDFIGLPVTKIGTYEIRYYLATEMERGLKERSVENTRSNISTFFQWLTNEEVIPKNPCSVIKPIKTPKVKRKAFNSVEMDAIRHACLSKRDRAMIEILASSGVRVAELEKLDVSDIDFNSMTVTVRCGKGGKDRTTYLSDVAKYHLQMYLRSRKEAVEALFCSFKHKRISRGGVRDVLIRIGKRAGVTNVHPHRFRRTLATTLAARGMPVQEIQQILGHTNIETTMRYISIDDMAVKSSYDKHIA